MKVWSALLALALLQQTPAVRDSRLPAATGSGVIRGVVVDELDGQPLSGARVTASQRGTDARSPVLFSTEVTAGDDGRFELTGLPAGELVISASAGELRATHLGHIVGHEDGQPHMGKPSLRLGPGEVRLDLRIVLKRAAALEGVVVDERGEPMAGVTVIGRSAAESLGGAGSMSDDRGWFRIFGLRPGPYVVCAEAERPWNTFPAVDAIRTRYARSCAPEVRVSPTEVPMVQLQMQRVGSYTLSGRVIRTSGSDLSKISVTIMQVGADGERRSVDSETKNGEFIAHGLLPGDYTVFASVPDPAARDPFVLAEGGVSHVRIENADVADITLATTPAGSVVGRVVRDPQAKGALPMGLSVTARLPLPSDRDTRRPPFAAVNSAGAFEMRGVLGPQALTVTGLSGTWFVASMRQGNEDIHDRPRNFAQDDRPVVIVLSDRAPAVRARPLDRDGKPHAAAMVVAIPADPARWHVAPVMSTIRRDLEGYQQLAGIAPGDYYLTAITLADLTAWSRSATTLESLARIGRRVTLSEEQPLVLDLVVASPGDAR